MSDERTVPRGSDEAVDGVVDEAVVEATIVDEGGSDDQPIAEISELDAARAESAQYLDDLKRLQAEFENFRKRMVREQSQVFERAVVGVVERILPVLDNFDLALIAAGTTQDFASMVRGVELVYSELRDALAKLGLERMEVVGKPFDPACHEAVMHDGDGETVLDEMRPGYTFAGRVVRPAMVKVGETRPG